MKKTIIIFGLITFLTACSVATKTNDVQSENNTKTPDQTVNITPVTSLPPMDKDEEQAYFNKIVEMLNIDSSADCPHLPANIQSLCYDKFNDAKDQVVVDQ